MATEEISKFNALKNLVKLTSEEQGGDYVNVRLENDLLIFDILGVEGNLIKIPEYISESFHPDYPVFSNNGSLHLRFEDGKATSFKSGLRDLLISSINYEHKLPIPMFVPMAYAIKSLLALCEGNHNCLLKTSELFTGKIEVEITPITERIRSKFLDTNNSLPPHLWRTEFVNGKLYLVYQLDENRSSVISNVIRKANYIFGRKYLNN